MEHRRRVLAACAALLCAATARAETPRDRVDHAAQYRACVTLAGRDAEEALEAAAAWRDVGGGAAARHCEALALVQLERYDEAAQRLDELARTLPPESEVAPADLLAQAANAWLLAGRADRAETAIVEALKRAPDDANLFVDHARVLAEQGRYEDALRALDQALARQSDHADALAFRAAALRHLGRLDEALEAVNESLLYRPDNPSARLERGVINHLRGNVASARRDWTQTAERYPGTPAAEAANAYLAALDVRTE